MSAKKLRILLVACLLLAAASVFFYFQSQNFDGVAVSGGSENELVDLERFAEFRQVFESDSGYVRLVTILSPV